MATARSAGAAFLTGLTVSTAALAQEAGAPLSAIDWLSDSVEVPQSPIAPDVLPGAPAPDVTVRSLDAEVIDTTGLLEAADLGLPADLWGAVSAADLADAIRRTPLDLPPSAARFLRDLLLARTRPPVDAVVDDSLFLARVDRLLDLGHLDDAKALIEAAEPEDPRLFRRSFDIALLTAQETGECLRLEEDPDLLPTFPARIFCLARNGEWDVAALTLGIADTLGYLDEDEEALLLTFLDPELFEGEVVPVPPQQPTPLTFRLYDAIGERMSTESLPVAFAEADLWPTVGWKAQVRAAERLLAADALSVDRFLVTAMARQPAASGAFWDRIEAIQGWQVAMTEGDTDLQEKTLAKAWSAALAGGTAAAFAEAWIDTVANGRWTGPAKRAGFEIALFADRPEVAQRLVSGAAEDRLALDIALGQSLSATASDDLSRAVVRGLSAVQPLSHHLEPVTQEGHGIGILLALRLISEGGGGDPAALEEGLALLRHLGQEDLARRTALEMLLLDRAA